MEARKKIDADAQWTKLCEEWDEATTDAQRADVSERMTKMEVEDFEKASKRAEDGRAWAKLHR